MLDRRGDTKGLRIRKGLPRKSPLNFLVQAAYQHTSAYAKLLGTTMFADLYDEIKQVRDYKHFLELLNAIMTKFPIYNVTGCVGFPINARLDWAMGTEGGFAAFLNDKLNAQFKKVLDHWGTG